MNHGTDDRETIASLLHTIALIREAAGVDEKPMLSELPDAIRKLREERDEARRWFCFEARQASDRKNSEIRAKEIADIFFWDCFKEDTNA